MAGISGLRACASLVFDAEIATARSDSAWIFEPGFRGPQDWDRSEVPSFGPDGDSFQDRAGPVDHSLAAEFIEYRAMQPAP